MSDISITIPPLGVITSKKTVEEERKPQSEIPTPAELVNELQQLRECICKMIKVHEEHIRVLHLNNSLLEEQLNCLRKLVSREEQHDHSG